MNTPWITTYTGKTVNPLDLKPEDIDVEDIAHHLSIQTRWVGATEQPITTAQHSYFVSRLCEAAGPIVQLQGLFHDATEAYLGDVTKWVKASPSMAPYREAEDRAWKVISGVLGVPYELHFEVQRADRVMASFEAIHGMKHVWPGHTISGYEKPSDIDVAMIGNWWFWNWRVAQSVFIQRYNELSSEITRIYGRNRV